jgi:hypothetical protein
MKKLLLPLVVLASLTAYAGEKGNGGETVDVSGIPRLRDLVENTSCRWADGASIMEANPMVNDVLKRLSYVDWYFAEELKQEIRDLDYCLTGNLVKIDTKDAESLVTTYNFRSSQVAIRLNRQVYLNTLITTDMPEADRAFLLIHESMHSYVLQEEWMRNQKVRSMVRAIEAVYKGEISTTRSFHLQMKNNEIKFPMTSIELRPLKEAVLFVISDYEVRRQMLLSTKSIEEFMKSIRSINPILLAKWHQEALQRTNAEELINSAIAYEDIEVIKMFVNDLSTMDLTLALLYTSPAAQDSAVIRDFLEAQGSLNPFLRTLLKELLNKEVSINAENRIVVKGMNVLATNWQSDETPFTTLEAVTGNNDEIHPKMRGLVKLIGNLIAKKDFELLGKMTYENPEFYQAFRKDVKEQIAATRVSFELEKTVAIRKVDTLVDGFWKYTKTQLGKEAWEKFSSKIDTTKLGYEIK